MLILNRSFYAVQTNWVPTAVALGAVALNAALNAVFYRFGIWGIPLATAVVNIVGAATLLVLMRRRVGLEAVARDRGRRRADRASRRRSPRRPRSAPGTALDDWLGRSAGAQVVSVGRRSSAAGLVYLGAARALRVRELEALLLLRARRDEP